MEQVKRCLRWALLLWKRLYKKWTFVVLLLLIPLLVLAYGLTAQEESGMSTVALAVSQGQPDQLTQQVWQALEESSLVRYIRCDSPEAARQLVQAGQADTAWIFADELEARVYDFVAKRTQSNAFVTVLEPENRVLLKLLREVLSGTMFPYCAEATYLTYIRENAPELAQISDETLLEYYHNAGFEEGLFQVTDLEGNVVEAPSYLLAPVRGMLAVLTVLAGLAAAMYYLQDEQSGTFARVPLRRKPLLELGCQLITVGNVLVVVLLALALTGQRVHWGREVLVAGMYTLCVAAFAMLLRRISGGIRGLSMAAPLLVVVMLVVCPVFFDLGALRQLQGLFPPTYFVNAAYSNRAMGHMAMYTLALLTADFVLDRIPKRA